MRSRIFILYHSMTNHLKKYSWAFCKESAGIILTYCHLSCLARDYTFLYWLQSRAESCDWQPLLDRQLSIGNEGGDEDIPHCRSLTSQRPKLSLAQLSLARAAPCAGDPCTRGHAPMSARPAPSLRAFVRRAQVLRLYRAALRAAPHAREAGAGEARAHIAAAGVALDDDPTQERFLLDQGAKAVEELRKMTSLTR